MENKQRPVIAETRELVQKYHVLEKAQILVRGRFVFLIVSQNAQEYSSLFTNSL